MGTALNTEIEDVVVPCECGRTYFHRFSDAFMCSFRWQHGPNPEHSLRLTTKEILNAPAPFEPGFPVREWLDRVHEREACLAG